MNHGATAVMTTGTAVTDRGMKHEKHGLFLIAHISQLRPASAYLGLQLELIWRPALAMFSVQEEHDPGPSSSHLHEGQFKMTLGMDGHEEADWHIKKHVAKAKRRQNLSEPPPDNLTMDHWDPPGRGKRPCG